MNNSDLTIEGTRSQFLDQVAKAKELGMIQNRLVIV